MGIPPLHCGISQRVKICLVALPVDNPAPRIKILSTESSQAFPWPLIAEVPAMERAAAAESRGAGQIISDSIIRKTFKLTKKNSGGEKAHEQVEGCILLHTC